MKNKNAFEVYLPTGEKISVSAEWWDIEYSDKGRIAFHADQKIVAVFMLAGICGFAEVD